MRPGAALVRCVVVAVLVAAIARPVSAQTDSTGTATYQTTSTIDASSVQSTAATAKMGALARARGKLTIGRSRVIVQFVQGVSPSSSGALVQELGGSIKKALPLLNAQVIELPNPALTVLAGASSVARVSVDRRIEGATERTGATIGAVNVRSDLGLDGSGVGIAVIDSGVTPWHDDLAAAGGGQRVNGFVDLVNGWASPYDDYGHGTHVAGIIAGNGFDSSGARTGIAPGARLFVFKALDGEGRGYISDVITALDYIVARKHELNIRVVNLSVAAPVYESYNTDPLTLAAKRAVDAGIVVVAAAGNRGRNPNGADAYAGITAPGNAPWVLTVGASSHSGTVARADDTMAAFSSRGPTAADYSAKPDLVAPGVGIESLSDPVSAFYRTLTSYLLPGTVPTAYLPYLSLSGSSMAAPVVTGTVALMLQAHPALTPNAIKAILQFTSEVKPEYDPLTAGAGFLNAAGAVALARFFADETASEPFSSAWSGRVIWGNQLFVGGRLGRHANAWAPDVAWGAPTTPAGDAIQWGQRCAAEICDSTQGWIPWGISSDSLNVVWGAACGGGDCLTPWTVAGATTESVVWGTSEGESVVWGTSESDESVVWGTSCRDAACQPIIWSRP